MLEARNVSVSYGRHRALEGAALRVGKGEICVILGANGAGKSTLLKTIAGMVRGEPGCEIVMNGRRIETMKPHRIVEEGIALVPEGRGIFGDLTVAENLQLGAFASRARSDEAASLKRIYALFPRLAERKGQVARTMSGGEQQMVAIGRALMSKPEILMLDEPSLGLSPLLCQELFRSLSEIAASGVGILLVEQNARQSLKIARRGYLIENGHVTGEASAKELMNDPAVINAYLGGAAAGAAASTVRLPPSMRLPAGLEAMGRLMSALAERAGRIHRAFIRSLRFRGELPSAFVGRYDPKEIADPWETLALEMRETAAPRRPLVSTEARRAGADAASLATRARERMAAHVATARLNAARPSAFPSSFSGLHRQAEASPPSSAAVPRTDAIALDAADLARRAGERLAAHIAAARNRTSEPVTFYPPARAPDASRDDGPDEIPMQEPAHGLIGHNSAGFEFEDEDGTRPKPSQGLSIAGLADRAASIHAAHVAARRAAFPVRPDREADSHEPQAVRKPASTPVAGSIAELVARAAEVQAAHVATQRKALTAFTLQAGGSSSVGTASRKHGASKKRKKHKEK